MFIYLKRFGQLSGQVFVEVEGRSHLLRLMGLRLYGVNAWIDHDGSIAHWDRSSRIQQLNQWWMEP